MLEVLREAALTARADELEWPAQAAEFAHWASVRDTKVRTPNMMKVLSLLCLSLHSRLLLRVFAFRWPSMHSRREHCCSACCLLMRLPGLSACSRCKTGCLDMYAGLNRLCKNKLTNH